MEFRLYRVPYLQLVLDRRHLQSAVQNRLPINVIEPGMLFDRLRIFFAAEPLLRILAEQFLDEISKELRGIFGEAYDSSPDEVVKLSLGVGVEGREAGIELIEHDAELIPVSHAVMPLFVDDLQREVGGGPAERFVDLVQVLLLLAQPEVSYQRVALLVQHDVLGLQVPVQDLVFVQSVDPQQNLACVVPHVLLFELFALLEQF